MEGKKALIITIGNELLIGQVMDTNSPWIAQQLEVLNIPTSKRLAIPDSETVIIESLDESISQADLIILTGGLGPTKDDLTKNALAKYFRAKLIRNDAVSRHITTLVLQKGRTLTAEIEDQALVPENCTTLQNEIGTAPGMWFEKSGTIIISLPGVPHEMKNIFEKEVIPKLKEKHFGFSRQHRYFLLPGAAETDISRKIASVEDALPSYISLAYLPGMGLLRLRLTGSHENARQLQKELDNFSLQIKTILRNQIAAEKDIPIEAVVGEVLKEKKLKIGFAESCTGGLLANKITNIPGSSAYFNGAIISYANDVKEGLLGVSPETLATQGAVSEETVLQMAQQARKLLKTDIALSVSGVLGPGGGSAEKPVGTVWMAISDKYKTEAKLFHFWFDRLQNKERAANAALGWLYQWLTNNSI